MPLPVSLMAVAEELELVGDAIYAYLNRQTGELITVTADDLAIVEEGYDPEEYSEWEQEKLAEVAQVLDSTDFVRLPAGDEIDEWAMMKGFAQSVADEEQREDLLQRLHGTGAFRRFKDGIYRYDLRDEWFRYQKQALAEIAAEFLETEGIPYER